MMKMKMSINICKVEVTYKEINNNNISHNSYLGNDDLTLDFVIKFFGLKEPDIEWYNVKFV